MNNSFPRPTEETALLFEANQYLAGLLTSSLPQECSVLAEATFWNAKFISETTGGFIALQKTGLMEASKLLIRPMIETVLWMAATEKEPEVLYRWVFKQVSDEKKALKRLVGAIHEKALADSYDNELRSIRGRMQSEHPCLTFLDCDIDLKSALRQTPNPERKGLEMAYDESYPTYCQYTHGTFRVKAGQWDLMHPLNDNYYVGLSIACAVISLKNHAAIWSTNGQEWLGKLQDIPRYRI